MLARYGCGTGTAVFYCAEVSLVSLLFASQTTILYYRILSVVRDISLATYNISSLLASPCGLFPAGVGKEAPCMVCSMLRRKARCMHNLLQW